MSDKRSTLVLVARMLGELERIKPQFGAEAGRRKRDMLHQLEHASLPSAQAVYRLHELLCFWRAYPDDARLLAVIERMLRTFATRDDLKRHRAPLVDSGIAGTEIRYEFYMQMAQWLAQKWPRLLEVDWMAYQREGKSQKLEKILHLLATYGETPGLDEFAFSVREWVARLKSPGESDAVFLVRRMANLPLDTFQHEFFYEDLGLPLRVVAAPAGPSRTRAKLRGMPAIYHTPPLRHQRPDLPTELRRPPLSICEVSPSRGRRLIDLAREAMATRSRDLDIFAFGDPRDVRIVDCGDGLQFVAIGAIPVRRLMFEAVYGFLTFKNGVPIGYVLNSALFNSVEVAYNVFETYRGAEAGYIYGRLLATLRVMFGADTFTIYPYQLGGEGNEEGLRSGAWWFYQKLGFRARDPQVLRLMRRELARMKSRKRHRSSIATLKRLGRENVYYDLKKTRQDVIGELPLAEVGLKITDYLAERFGSDRHQAERVCAREAMVRLGLRSLAGFSSGERLAWHRWSPLLMILPGVDRWDQREKQALVEVVRAKGGQRESDFALKFDRHRKLRRVIKKLARGGGS